MMTIDYTLAIGIEKARLDAAWPHMSDWAQQTFADIQNKAKRYANRPTDGQRALIEKLLAEAEAKAARGRAAAAPRLDLTRVTTMFDKAAETLKRPFVIFATYKPHPTDPKKQVVDVEFRVSQAPATGKNPGSLYVKRAGEYQGKIARDGTFSAARDAHPGMVEALRAFAADPARAALAYGQATSNCCFCARELTDQRSVDAGYGPICASRFGLPWGLGVNCEEVA